MSLVAKSLFLLASLGAIAAQAQFNTNFQYVVVIVQENRTPDNLFGQRTNGQFFEPGVNLATTANNYGQTVPLTPIGLQTCYDINHFHSDFIAMYDNGLMDGANGESTYAVPPCNPPKTNYAFTFVATLRRRFNRMEECSLI